MSCVIEHELLAPDGRSLAVIARTEAAPGETIQAAIDRASWFFHLPTRAFLNGEVLPPDRLRTHVILETDEVRIVSRPGRGGAGQSGGSGAAKSVGAIVAMISLAALAPFAGPAVAAAMGLEAVTLGGAAIGQIFSGVVLAGESWVLTGDDA